MEYTDNPRKIYGRVEIVYSDAEISKDIRTAESGNAAISHPDEVHKGYSSPTVKACTMDGNATMDGSFRMMDDSCVCGWWSKAMADANGTFNNGKPFIELSFVQRPVISWIVRGDDKLKQFPVDFVVEYKRGGTSVFTERVTANAKLEVKLEPKLADIDAIRMTITKWNTPNACTKILQFYDKLYESYEGDAVQVFEVNEEMGSEEVNYNINSDTASVTLLNNDRKFDRGYLRSLLLLDRKITFSIGVEKNGTIEYSNLGRFYSDEWQVSQDSQWVQCQAVDKLIRLQDKEYVGFPLTKNVSLKEIAKDIFDKLGYKSKDYDISNSLADVIVPNACLPKTTAWDALQEIANAGLCRVYVDRNDRIVVRSEADANKESGVRINAGNMFSAKSNITLTEFANQVEVEYTEVTLSEDIVETAETEVTLSPGESINLNLGYTSEIANAWIESDNANVRLTGFNSGIDACKVTATNTGGGYQTAKIKVTGNAIVENSRSVILKDEDSIRSYGVTEYKHPASELVQTMEHANYIASVLLKNMRAGEGVVTTVWRGTPDLELGAEFDYTDRFGGNKRLVCESNKFTYDGSLKAETRGRKSKRRQIVANWKEPKTDYTAGSQVTPAIFNGINENQAYLKETKITTEQVQNAVVSSSENPTRTNIGASENVKSAFGKIRKWFADLRAMAFKNTVGTSDLDNLCVTTPKLAGEAVTDTKIAPKSVLTEKINDLAVTESKLGNGAVVNAKLGNLAVTASKIAAGAVETVKLANLAVTTSKLADGAVTNEKVSSVAASKVTGLATVAVSGSYNDLKDKPNIPAGLTVVNNLTSTSTTSALSAYQGKVLNDRLNSLGFSAGACSLTQTGILNVASGNTFTEYAPDGSTPSLQSCNYYIKCGKYVMCHLELVGQSTSKGDQLAANASFAYVPYSLRPRSSVSAAVTWQKTYSWSTTASGGTAHKTESTTYGVATATVSSGGYISVNMPVKYSTNSSAGKTSAGGSTVSGFLVLNMFWRMN